MDLTADSIRRFLEREVQPKVRVDGGNILFERLTGTDVHLGAHAECSTCPAASGCMKDWLEREFHNAFGSDCRVVVHSRLPYYKR